MVYVGDIYIQSVSDLDTKTGDREVTEINGMNLMSSIAPPKSERIGDITMKGAIYTESGVKEDDYAESVYAIKERTGAYNYIKYVDTDGFIEATSVDIPKSAELANERMYTVKGKFLPAAQHEPTYVLNTEGTMALNNSQSIVHGIPPYVALPIGARNVKIKSPYQTLNLSAPSYNLTSPSGQIPVYQPFPMLSPCNNAMYTYGMSAGAQVIYDTSFYNMCCMMMDCSKSTASVGIVSTYNLYVGIDIPRGTYKLVFKMKYDANTATVDADKRLYVNAVGRTYDDQTRTLIDREYFTPKPVWGMFECETEISVTDFDEQITINFVSDNFYNTLYIEYAYLTPTYLARVSYDMPETVVEKNVYVYDHVDGVFVRVHSKNHIFKGEIYIGNALYYWILDPAQYWQDTGYIVDTLNNVSGLKLYPEAFKYDKPKVMITSILPDEVKFQIVCDQGTVARTKMITDVSMLPYATMFDVRKVNKFKNDWIMTADEKFSDFNYYNNTFTVKDSTGADEVSIANNTMFCYFKYATSLCQLSKNTGYSFSIENSGKVHINSVLENNNSYKFMFSSTPMVTMENCYSDNIFCAGRSVTGERAQTYDMSEHIKSTPNIKQYLTSWMPQNTTVFENNNIVMKQDKSQSTVMFLKNQKFNECDITIKGTILL